MYMSTKGLNKDKEIKISKHEISVDKSGNEEVDGPKNDGFQNNHYHPSSLAGLNSTQKKENFIAQNESLFTDGEIAAFKNAKINPHNHPEPFSSFSGFYNNLYKYSPGDYFGKLSAPLDYIINYYSNTWIKLTTDIFQQYNFTNLSMSGEFVSNVNSNTNPSYFQLPNFLNNIELEQGLFAKSQLFSNLFNVSVFSFASNVNMAISPSNSSGGHSGGGSSNSEFIGTSSGNASFVGNGSSIANYSSVIINLMVDIYSTEIKVIKGTYHDILTGVSTVITGSGDDNFILSTALNNYTFNGGSGSNTLNYSGIIGGITIDLISSKVNLMSGYTDTISNIHNFIGTAQSDTFIGLGTGSYNFSGNSSDLVTYSSISSNLIFTENASNIVTVNKGSGQIDTFNSVNNFIGSMGINTIVGNFINGITFTGSNNNGSAKYTSISSDLTITEIVNGLTVAFSSNPSIFDTLNNIYTFTGGTGTNSFIGTDNGSYSFTGNRGDIAYYNNLSSPLTITEDPTKIFVIKNGGTDTLSLMNIVGSALSDSFFGNAVNGITFTGNSSDIANYNGLALPLTITEIVNGLTVALTSNLGLVDTLNHVYTFTGGTGTNSFIGADNGSYSFTGNTGDTAYYNNLSSPLTITEDPTKIFVIKNGGTDTLSLMNIVGSALSDSFFGNAVNGITFTGNSSDIANYNGLALPLTITEIVNGLTVALTSNLGLVDTLNHVYTFTGGTGTNSFIGADNGSYSFTGNTGDTAYYNNLSSPLTITEDPTKIVVTKNGGSDTLSLMNIVGSALSDSFFGNAVNGITFTGNSSDIANYNGLVLPLTITEIVNGLTVALTSNLGLVDTLNYVYTFTGGTGTNSFIGTDNGSYSFTGNIGDSATYASLSSNLIFTENPTKIVVTKNGGTDTLSLMNIVGSALQDSFFGNAVNGITFTGNSSDIANYNGLALPLTITEIVNGLTVALTSNLGLVDTLNHVYTFTGGTGTNSFIGADNGSYSFTGNTGDTAYYNNLSSPLTITENPLKIVVTKNGGTDTLSLMNIVGSALSDSFFGNAVNGITFTGNSSDIANYNGLALPLTITEIVNGLTVALTSNLGLVDTLNHVYTFTGGTGTNSFIGADNGSYSFTGNIGDTATYASLTSNLIFTEDPTKIFVTKSGGTDTLSLMNIVGSALQDSFFGNAVNGITFTGNSSDIANYNGLALPLTITEIVNGLTVALTSNLGLVDTLNHVYTFTGGTGTDSFIGTDNGSYSFTGNTGDTVYYNNLSSPLTITEDPTKIVVTKSGGTDTLSLMNIVGSALSDSFFGNAVNGITFTGNSSDIANYNGLALPLTITEIVNGLTVALTSNLGLVDTLNHVYTFTGGTGTNSFIGADNGSYSFTGNIGDSATYASLSSPLTITEDPTKIVVTKSGGTDTLTLMNIAGSTGSDSFFGNAVNGITFTGNSSDIANYNGLALPLTITEIVNGLTVALTSNLGLVDTLNHVYTFTGGTGTNSFVGANNGSYSFTGNIGDTATYASLTSNLTFTENPTSISVTKGGGTDTLTLMNIAGGTGSDSFFGNAVNGITFTGNSSDIANYNGLALPLTITEIVNGLTVALTSNLGLVDTLNQVYTFTGGTGTNSFIGADNGSYSFTGNIGDTATYASLTSNLTFTENPTSISVTKGGGTDTLTLMNIAGGTGSDSFFGNAVNGITFTGNSSDIANYNGLALPLTITEIVNGLTVALTSNLGLVDTLNQVYTFTGGTGTNSFIGADNGSYSFTGNIGDTATYASLSSNLTFTENPTSISVTKGGGTDTLTLMNIAGGTGSDSFFGNAVNGITFTGNSSDIANYNGLALPLTITEIVNGLTVALTSNLGLVDTLNQVYTFTGGTGTNSFIGADNGSYSFTGNIGDTATYASLSSNLTFTENPTSISVTKGGGTDTLTLMNIAGGTGSDSFFGNAVNGITFTGNSSDIANYNGLALPLTINEIVNGLTVALTSNLGLVDTLNHVYTFTGGTGTNSFIGADNGSYSFTGNTGDTAYYNNLSSPLTITENPLKIVVTKNGGTDTLSLMNIVGSALSDSFFGNAVNGITFTGNSSDIANYNGLALPLTITEIVNGLTVALTSNLGLVDTLNHVYTFTGGTGTNSFVGANNGSYSFTGNIGDTATYASLSSNLTFTENPTSISVTKGGGTDTLTLMNIAGGTGSDSFFGNAVNGITFTGNSSDIANYNGLALPLTITEIVNGLTVALTSNLGLVDTLNHVYTFTGGTGTNSFIGADNGSYSFTGNIGDTATYASLSSNLTFTENPTSISVTKGSGTDTLTLMNIAGSTGSDSFFGNAVNGITFTGNSSDIANYNGLALPLTITEIVNGLTVALTSNLGLVDTLNHVYTFTGGTGTNSFIGADNGSYSFHR